MISVILLTYNAGDDFEEMLSMLRRQTLGDVEIVVIDSGSTDDTLATAARYDAKIITIPNETFDHGGTRTVGAKNSSGDFLVYLTQDAIPCDEYALENLLKPFNDDPGIAAVYGRQLPHSNSGIFGAHLRKFNYPDISHVKSMNNSARYGLKTAFLSNSFSAYRRSALEDIGWFRSRLIMGEDSCACALLVLKGHKIGYVADAMVYHSHDYSSFQEMKRYFDIGVFHSIEKWLINSFGVAENEGLRYVKSELNYIVKRKKYHLLPKSFVRNVMKYIGYKLGYNYKKLPLSFVRKISMHRKWWNLREPSEQRD